MSRRGGKGRLQDRRYGLEPLPEDATDTQRQERADELRRRRRRRIRNYLWGSGIGTVAIIALVALLLYWLLDTIAGRNFLLARIKGSLPQGTELSWERAEGPANGPLKLHGVRFVYRGCPDVDGKPVRFPNCAKPEVTTFTAKTIVLDAVVKRLLDRKLRLSTTSVTDATLDLPKSEKPFELPRWPQSLPQVKPPLPIQVDDLRIDRLAVTQVGVPLVNVASVRGALDVETDRLHAERLVANTDRGDFTLHGDYVPRDNYAMNLTATARMPAPLGKTRPVLALVARGDLTRLDASLNGYTPAPLFAHLTLRGGEHDPSWQLRANSTALDPSLLAGTGEASEPIAFNLTADGVGGAANVRGQVDRGSLHATIQPSKVRIADQTLALNPVVVDIFGGRITATGSGDFSKAQRGRLSFAVNARGLRWGSGAQAVGASGDFGFAGYVNKWNAVGRGVLVRDGQRANVNFDGVGDPDGVTFQRLTATMPQGRLDGDGRVGWTPTLHWKANANLAGFDPGYFLSEWPGALNGRVVTTGNTRGDGRMEIGIDAQQLGGRLRGRSISGRATVALRTAATARDVMDLSGDIALSLGNSRINARGRIDRSFDVDARVSPLHLDDLLPNAAGVVSGTLKLTGPRNAPDIDADLSGSRLRYDSWRANTLIARGRLPWRNGSGDITVQGTGVQAGMGFERIEAHATGAMENLQLTANGTASGIGQVALSGSARRTGADWHGTLASLQFDPLKGAAWRLSAPAQFAQRGSNWTLSQSCFSSDAGGSLCANADWPRGGVRVNGNGLPLALLLPYLPPRADGKPWDLQGDFALTGQVQPVGGSWRGTAHVASTQGGIRLPVKKRLTAFTYQSLTLDATFDPNRIQAKLSSGFNGSGRIIADVATGWDANAPLSGSLDIDTRDLTLIELFSPDIVDPTGHLSGHILLAGSRAAPRIGGDATLTEFRTEVPSLGLVLTNGELRMQAQADGNARITGTLRSGEGTLNVDGTLGWRGQDTPLVLNVRGRNVLVSDTRNLQAIADPDVVVRFRAGDPLQVSGTVGIPSARIDLERLSSGVGRSSDVVVLDPVDPERASSALPLDLDLRLVLGDNVNLNGFGLKGTLGGSLRVRARPGREMVATGTLDVDGRYRAYGQNLDITRGRLVWSNDAVANPMLDVRAERDLGDVTAGIAVTGRATRPQATVWSNPASSQEDAIAYLTTGRSLSGLDGDTARQVSSASAALSAGQGLLVSQLAARMGLDNAGVMQSRALGGSVLGVGKYISPRLYVGFGVSLLGTGQVLMLKYLLRKGFDIEIESSSLENRGSVNWRKEK